LARAPAHPATTGDERERVDRAVAAPGGVDELAALGLVADLRDAGVEGEAAEEVAAEEAGQAYVVGGSAYLA
jgi:hypothetical protein